MKTDESVDESVDATTLPDQPDAPEREPIDVNLEAERLEETQHSGEDDDALAASSDADTARDATDARDARDFFGITRFAMHFSHHQKN